jgi:hypothetical protein
MDKSNTIQVPAIQVSDELAATESSRPPDKVLLVPPSVPRLVRHPALSITTHLFGSAATPIEYSILSPYPIFCTGRCREEPERDVEQKADVVRANTSNITVQPIPYCFVGLYISYERLSTFLGKRSWVFDD